MSIARVIKKKSGTVITVPPDTPVVEAARLLSEKRIGILVVCTAAGRLAGVLSERDIVMAVARQADQLSSMLVGALVTKSVVTCTPDDDAQKVVQTMRERGFRHMPVVSYGKVVGVVSISDLLRFLKEEADLRGDAAVWSELDFL